MTAVTLSKTTLAILKNFATINTSIVVKTGNVLKTISNAENIPVSYTHLTLPTSDLV